MPNLTTSSPNPKNDEAEDHIDIEDIFGSSSPYDNTTKENTMKAKKKKEKQMNNTPCLILFLLSIMYIFFKNLVYFKYILRFRYTI